MIVVRETPDLEVLMVQRSNRGMFANAMVFPGGMLESEDHLDDWLPHLRSHETFSPFERALRISAIREVWEETGILLFDHDDDILPEPPSNEPGAFFELVKRHEAVLDLMAVQPFSNWITPEGAPKRYDTYFFLAHFKGQHDGASDGVETVGLKWLCPRKMIERHEKLEIDLLIATMGNLCLLNKSETLTHAFEEARNRPLMPVIPCVKEISGKQVVTVPDGTPFDGLAIPTERVVRPHRTLN